MITAGVDLAASPATTGVAVLSGRRDARARGRGRRRHARRAHRHARRASGSTARWAGRATSSPCSPTPPSPPPAGSVAERDRLAYRETDRWVRAHAAPLRPLSVSADRIAHAAFRCAALLPRLGQPVDRTGHGRVVETYPAGSLLRWGLPFRRYKGADGRVLREQIVDALAVVLDLDRHRAPSSAPTMPWTPWSPALTARAAALGRRRSPRRPSWPWPGTRAGSRCPPARSPTCDGDHRNRPDRTNPSLLTS